MKYYLTIAAILVPVTANAEVVGSSSHGFEIRHVVPIVAPPNAAFAAFTQIPGWWDKAHTYSGKSSNLSLTLRPGGCFCEQLDEGGGVEHMRVAYIAPGKRLVMTGSLGPLVYEATSGVMDVQFEGAAGGSKMTLTYKVAGFANGGAERLAPLVDGVLAQQVAHFRKFATARPRSR